MRLQNTINSRGQSSVCARASHQQKFNDLYAIFADSAVQRRPFVLVFGVYFGWISVQDASDGLYVAFCSRFVNVISLD